jgi:UV excision repair protein RAD23
MKLVLKSLKQISYEMVIESADITVEEFKKQIESKHGFEAKYLKLLYNGAVLADDKKLSDYNMADEHVIMMIYSKIKPINVKKEEEKKEETVPKEGDKLKKDDKKEDKKETQKAVVPAKNYDKEIQNLVDMGFSKDQATAAINAAKGNVTMAVEYLYNGIPSTAQTGANPQFHEFLDEDYEEDEDEEYEGGANILDILNPDVLSALDLKDPNTIKTIASVVKIITSQDSSQLPDILAEIEETNPEIIEFIKKHETVFRTELEKPLSEQDLVYFNNFAGAGPVEEAGDEYTSPVENPDLSNTDKEVIERLKGLGFTEEECVQAYLACDKNEMMAANFLIENKYKDMDVDCKLFLNLDDESELSQSSKKDDKK